MSRIGNKAVEIVDKVTVTVKTDELSVKGPLGELKRPIHPKITIKVDGNTATVTRADDTKESRSLHGLYRALLANMVTGVSAGFTKGLDLVGVGYRADLKGKVLELALGYSHPIQFEIPEGITVKVDKQTHIDVSGADKEQVGQVAAELRMLRKPEPYKGKGVRYSDEVIRKKAGKSAAK